MLSFRARPGIQGSGEISIPLDPGSHPAPRDLAGMTNYDIDTNGHGTGVAMEKIIGHPKNIELFLVF
jgi:hypothetical protein